MARNTLLALRARVLSMADMPADGFVSNTELDHYINDSYEDLYELLVQLHEGYFESEHSISIVPGQQEYALPSDFFKLVGVDVKISGTGDEWYSVRRYTNAERNRLSHRRMWRLRDLEGLRYMLRGANIRFTPTPAGAHEARILYVPQVVPLEQITDEIVDTMVAGWARWIVVDAAIKCLNKEESNTQALVLEREKMEAKIRESAVDRDANEPVYVADVRGATRAYGDDIEEWM